MKAITLLALCAALVACASEPEPAPAGAPPATASPIPLDEPTLALVDSPLCHPLPVRESATAAGRAFRTGAFWLLELRISATLPCTFGDLRELFAKLNACLTNDACGTPFDAAKLAPILEPIEKGQSIVTTIGGVPVEVYTTSTRMRVLMAPTANPLSVLRGLDPKLKLASAALTATSTGAEPPGAAATVDADESTEVAGGCCGGFCTPCGQGQCEPRPGVIIRNTSVIRYECACPLVCASLQELPPDCECRDRCLSTVGCP
jgi:hypothetical protein